MESSSHFPLNAPFKPAPALVTSMLVNFILVFLAIAVSCVFPLVMSLGTDPIVLAILCFILVSAIVIFVVWVRLYYASMWYELREDEMSWRRGVWFRTTGIVPYNRITNIDVRQGPVMRVLGISTLSVQTAGYSGQAVPEIRIEGMEHAEELRELIRSLVRQPGNAATLDGTGGEPAGTVPEKTDCQILSELVRIRQLLEQQRK